MKRISKEEASIRIYKIAKSVAEQEAINGTLSPLETIKVRNTIAKILAASDIDDETLDKIANLDLDDEKCDNVESAEEEEEEKQPEQLDTDDKDDPVGVSLMKIGKGSVKQFINSNKNKKLNNKDLAFFIDELKLRGIEFKPSTLAKRKLGELFVAIEEAISKEI